jgi:hypothetical protein
MKLTPLVALGVIFACVSPIRAQDMVDNPEFMSWSKFKKGTSVSLKSLTMTKARTSEVILTMTLVDVGTDKLVIESTSLVKMKDKDFKTEPEKREVLRTIPLPKGLSRQDFASGKPPGTTEEGAETLKVGDQELKAKWYKYSADVAGTKIDGKRWVSNDMPGSIVRNEMTTSGEFASTIKLELLELKKP